MCTETVDGVECGPCPDGYTGDGFNCDDVDEVRLSVCVFVCVYVCVFTLVGINMCLVLAAE